MVLLTTLAHMLLLSVPGLGVVGDSIQLDLVAVFLLPVRWEIMFLVLNLLEMLR